jgi:hypothetical protein
MTREKAAGLLDPADKQNIHKAITMLQELSNLRSLPFPSNPVEGKNRNIINFYSETLDFFVLPFITVQMSGLNRLNHSLPIHI